MTCREIASAIGKSERSVQRWAGKAGEKSASVADKLASAGHGRAASFSLDETVAIIETGLGKNAAELFRENAKRPGSGSGITPESISTIIRETVAALIPVFLAAANHPATVETTTAKTESPVQLQLPHFSPRDELRRIINQYASIAGSHRAAWSTLYREYYYRYHRNIRECARNRGMDTLDYAEDEGLMSELLCLASALLGAA